jgi:hypothetical protein
MSTLSWATTAFSSRAGGIRPGSRTPLWSPLPAHKKKNQRRDFEPPLLLPQRLHCHRQRDERRHRERYHARRPLLRPGRPGPQRQERRRARRVRAQRPLPRRHPRGRQGGTVKTALQAADNYVDNFPPVPINPKLMSNITALTSPSRRAALSSMLGPFCRARGDCAYGRDCWHLHRRHRTGVGSGGVCVRKRHGKQRGQRVARRLQPTWGVKGSGQGPLPPRLLLPAQTAFGSPTPPSHKE